MNKADEMFEELGYKIDIEVDYGLIRYNKEDKYFIRFIIDDKVVETNTIVDNQIYILDIDMELLQVINQKCKELRMGLEKAIEHGKEHRKPYRKSKAFNPNCRNHGTCMWCRENRLHKFKKSKLKGETNE